MGLLIAWAGLAILLFIALLIMVSWLEFSVSTWRAAIASAVGSAFMLWVLTSSKPRR